MGKGKERRGWGKRMPENNKQNHSHLVIGLHLHPQPMWKRVKHDKSSSGGASFKHEEGTQEDRGSGIHKYVQSILPDKWNTQGSGKGKAGSNYKNTGK